MDDVVVDRSAVSVKRMWRLCHWAAKLSEAQRSQMAYRRAGQMLRRFPIATFLEVQRCTFGTPDMVSSEDAR
jgi:hypothetical protein